MTLTNRPSKPAAVLRSIPTARCEFLAHVHPRLPDQPLSRNFEVTVDGQRAWCYEARVYDNEFGTPHPFSDHHGRFAQFSHCSFCCFDLSGPVTVRIRCLTPVTSATVRPLSTNITTQIEADTIVFQLDRPRKLTVEINGTHLHALHLFASAPDTELPHPADENVLHFGPGLHEVDELPLRSNLHVHVAAGAVVRFMPSPRRAATLHLQDLHNVTFSGRGMLDSSRLARSLRQSFVRVDRCRNVTIRGLLLHDSAGWNLRIGDSTDVRVDDVKILSHRINADGINVHDCQRVRVRDCFVRNPDDGGAVKSFRDDVVTEDIVYSDCVLWCDQGWCLGPTYELKGEVRDIRYERCTVLHSTFRDNRLCVIGVYHTSQGHVHDVTFEDITIERARHAALGLKIECEPWSFGPRVGRRMVPWKRERPLGRISNIVFRNIHLFPQEIPYGHMVFGSGPQIFGSHFTEGSFVDDVRLEDVRVAGQAVDDLDAWGLQVARDTATRVRVVVSAASGG